VINESRPLGGFFIVYAVVSPMVKATVYTQFGRHEVAGYFSPTQHVGLDGQPHSLALKVQVKFNLGFQPLCYTLQNCV